MIGLSAKFRNRVWWGTVCALLALFHVPLSYLPGFIGHLGYWSPALCVPAFLVLFYFLSKERSHLSDGQTAVLTIVVGANGIFAAYAVLMALFELAWIFGVGQRAR